MKERPILFSTLMVQALLAGNKTQTRRLVKDIALEWLSESVGFSPDFTADPDNYLSPYGYSGDILWVRETWGLQRSDFEPMDVPFYCYKADDETYLPKWKPSIHMPKAACRIKLQITDIRIERVQNISNKDALDEGIEMSKTLCIEPMNAFAILWDSINKKRGYGWEKNPWVWVITFKKL